jgi:hypothetical protein
MIQHLTKTAIKKQIAIHHKVFKQSGNVFTASYKNDIRDVKVTMDYLHLIDDIEGDISTVILLLQDEDTIKKEVFTYKQHTEITDAIKQWINEQLKYGNFFNN